MTKHAAWKIKAIELFQADKAEKEEQARLQQEEQDAQSGEILSGLLTDLLGEKILVRSAQAEIDGVTFGLAYRPAPMQPGQRKLGGGFGSGGSLTAGGLGGGPIEPPVPYVDTLLKCALCADDVKKPVASLLEIGSAISEEALCPVCQQAKIQAAKNQD